MKVSNTIHEVKFEAECINQEQPNSIKPQTFSQQKNETLEIVVKKQESQNLFVFYNPEAKEVKIEEQATNQKRDKKIKKSSRLKPVKTKTVIIQKHQTSNDCITMKKCKDKRTGKYYQSTAQRFIKKITGYHYCKNFNQFYNKQLFLYIRENQQITEPKFKQWRLPDLKHLSYSMNKLEISDFTEHVLLSLKLYEPFMKKCRQQLIFQLFQQTEFHFFQYFFRNLIRKLYEIMIKVTYRTALKQMMKQSINTLEISQLNYNGLDQLGELQIAQAFNMTFQWTILQFGDEILEKRDFLRLKLEKLTQIE